MGDPVRRPISDTFDPFAAAVPRRRVLVLLGTGALATGGLGMLLVGCAPAIVTVAVPFDATTLVPGTPEEVPFTLVVDGTTVAASAWLVRKASGELVAFDPRCTHALCAYRWSSDGTRFLCNCHDGQFALDGTVLAGPPPRPLGQFPVRETPQGIELDVPADLESAETAPA